MISTLKKKLNKKGFTLAELLIVVAIIAVLVAIAIPVFRSQLEKANDAVDQANLRSAYAEAVVDYLEDGKIDNTDITYGDFKATATNTGDTITVKATAGLKGTKYNTYSAGIFSHSNT